MVLLIGAGLMIRSFYRLENVNPGFSYEQLTSFTVALPQKKYASEEQRSQFFNRLLQNIRSLPGVQSAAEMAVVADAVVVMAIAITEAAWSAVGALSQSQRPAGEGDGQGQRC